MAEGIGWASGLWLALVALAPVAVAAQADVRVRSFQPDPPLSRAQRVVPLSAVLENAGAGPVEVRLRLVLPRGVRAEGPADAAVVVPPGDPVRVGWTVVFGGPGDHTLSLELLLDGAVVEAVPLAMHVLPALEPRRLDYLPEPEPVRTPILVGAHHCPLWEADKADLWANVIKHPERTPALGFYNQENPEIADWETKWAVEHGISFFVYCWYRDGQGGPVQQRYGSHLHESLFRSRFQDQIKFTIMWENQVRGRAGVADERDLMENLLPFWIENYFRHDSYLKVDGKPVLFIYRPEFLIQDLGGEEQVAAAFERMREACRQAGFDGLWLLGEYRGLDAQRLQLMKRLGLDYTFAYVWPIPGSPTPEQAIEAQMRYLHTTQELGILPQVPTVSQAWSGWRDEGSIWKIPPAPFETLLRQTRDFMDTLPRDELGSRMLLLDNWNEWGEGHYLAPYREHGFGYLDAVRRVFAVDGDAPHVDLLPEDIGLGPYDTAIRGELARREELRGLARERATKPGAPEGLLGWWSFDEADGHPIALDVSGQGRGGQLRDATRAPGLDGGALVCSGGCAMVDPDPAFSAEQVSVECWVKTDDAGQDNRWLVNRIFAGGTDTGYRLGLLGGRPCFGVPVTPWSHHVQADQPLPTGRWVHLAGTFDGQTIRLYVDGELRGSMDRPGPAKPNGFRICLGSYDADHVAHFTGLLDEVRLYGRALSADEVKAHAQQAR